MPLALSPWRVRVGGRGFKTVKNFTGAMYTQATETQCLAVPRLGQKSKMAHCLKKKKNPQFLIKFN